MSEEIKRPVGRPRNPLIDREPMRDGATKSLNMKAKPNWEINEDEEVNDSPDRLAIPREMVPEGMAMMWVTDSVFGQSVPQHRAEFERRGWTPVHQSDFEGQFDGKFMPKGQEGEINVDGLVLMVRPVEMSKRAETRDFRKAREQIEIKERALRGGDIPGVSLDTAHPSAIRQNRVNRNLEAIPVPKD